jgi:hypothetical protein
MHDHLSVHHLNMHPSAHRKLLDIRPTSCLSESVFILVAVGESRQYKPLQQTLHEKETGARLFVKIKRKILFTYQRIGISDQKALKLAYTQL